MELRPGTSSHRRQNSITKFKVNEYDILSSLPAHIWIHGKDNTILYSNRFCHHHPVNQDQEYCHECLKGKKHACSCCKSRYVRNSLCPERCECERNGKIFNVYHFPYIAGDNSIQVIKFEIDASELETGQQKNMGAHKSEKLKTPISMGVNEFIGMCASCKKIRDDSNGKWISCEVFMRNNFAVEFSHGICPSCALELYPNLFSGHYSEDIERK